MNNYILNYTRGTIDMSICFMKYADMFWFSVKNHFAPAL